MAGEILALAETMYAMQETLIKLDEHFAHTEHDDEYDRAGLECVCAIQQNIDEITKRLNKLTSPTDGQEEK